MKTVVIMIGLTKLENNDINYLSLELKNENVYITNRSAKEVEYCLFGAGYNSWDVMVLSIPKEKRI